MHEPSPQPRTLLTAEQAARDVFGVSERTFHTLRARGLIPDPVMLGARSLRWVRAELETAALRLPRQQPQPQPTQLRRARIDAMKAGGKA